MEGMHSSERPSTTINEEQYILQPTGPGAVTTRGGSVCTVPWHGWLWTTWPHLLNVA